MTAVLNRPSRLPRTGGRLHAPCQWSAYMKPGLRDNVILPMHYSPEVLRMTEHPRTNTPLTEAQKNYDNDRKRIRSRKAALLDLLQDRNWHQNYELARVGGLSFNSYLYQLRNDGWEIRSRLRRGGIWEQKLDGRTAARRSRDGLSGPQEYVRDEFELAIQKVYGAQGLERVRDELSPWLRSAANSGLQSPWGQVRRV
jgi:hypothetical protein